MFLLMCIMITFPQWEYCSQWYNSMHIGVVFIGHKSSFQYYTTQILNSQPDGFSSSPLNRIVLNAIISDIITTVTGQLIDSPEFQQVSIDTVFIPVWHAQYWRSRSEQICMEVESLKHLLKTYLPNYICL